jgi:hypothetical protein
VVARAGRRCSAGHGLIEEAKRSLESGSSGLSVLRWSRFEGYVDIFEDGAWSDAAATGGRLDQVVARETAVFAAESIGKQERFRELTGVHQKACAVDGPGNFQIHKFHIPLGKRWPVACS